MSQKVRQKSVHFYVGGLLHFLMQCYRICVNHDLCEIIWFVRSRSSHDGIKTSV